MATQGSLTDRRDTHDARGKARRRQSARAQTALAILQPASRRQPAPGPAQTGHSAATQTEATDTNSIQHSRQTVYSALNPRTARARYARVAVSRSPHPHTTFCLVVVSFSLVVRMLRCVLCTAHRLGVSIGSVNEANVAAAGTGRLAEKAHAE